jgi:large subunit ribosomal protein L17
MRHRIKTNRLDRFSSYRKATVNSLVRAMILRHSVTTTYTKAKAAGPEVENLISLAKTNTLSARRQAHRLLSDHALVKKLFDEIADLFKERTSGYTRIFKLGSRRGDAAPMALLEFTERITKEKKPKREKAAKVKGAPAGHIPASEEKPHIPREEKPKVVQEKKPTRNFLGRLRGFFKRERDSL